jgi:hypothetical protein
MEQEQADLHMQADYEEAQYRRAIVAAENKVVTDAGHWYALDGTPKYTIVGKNGKERNTTLRDARKLNYLPSVTEIIKSAAKPALEIWKQKQVMLAALTLTRLQGESDEAFCDRVLTDSQEQAKKARDKGQAIHGAIECAIQKRPYLAEYSPHVQAVIGACDKEGIYLFDGEAEKSFGHPFGFGGKCDWHSFGANIVLDFKTKEKIDEKVKPYDDHEMQLAAYRMGLGLPRARRFNVFIGTEDQQVKVIELSPDNADRAERMFLTLLKFWQIDKNYFPGCSLVRIETLSIKAV